MPHNIILNNKNLGEGGFEEVAVGQRLAGNISLLIGGGNCLCITSLGFLICLFVSLPLSFTY